MKGLGLGWSQRRHGISAWMMLLTALLGCLPLLAHAQTQFSPGQTAEALRASLMQTQIALIGEPAAARAAYQSAQQAYTGDFAKSLVAMAPAAANRIQAGLSAGAQAVAAGDAVAFAVARAQVWTGVLDGAYQVITAAVQQNHATQAQSWLGVREFRHASRFSRPNANVTIALRAFRQGSLSVDEMLQAARADLLDTYQARLTAALVDLHNADSKGFASRRAELAALAEGYFTILAPAYTEQRGVTAVQTAQAAFARLRTTAANQQSVESAYADALAVLEGFRAAPLSPVEQMRRANQMIRFLGLVAVEYGRGVRNGEVISDLEVHEALTFHEGAVAAFTDLHTIFTDLDAARSQEAVQLFATLAAQLAAANTHQQPPAPAAVQAITDRLIALFQTLMPPSWRRQDSNADFDVIATALDQMETAVAAGRYDLAESARLDAYAILESGPEARLVAFAPQFVTTIEELFWYGQGKAPGLAGLIGQEAPAKTIAASRKALDGELASAQQAIGNEAAPMATLTNAAIIVFREGLEAVVILAALLASMVGGSRIYRRPMVTGVCLALAATALTWWLAQTVLTSFSRYGERLEAIVSLIAIGVLLLITNWFFHRIYWNDWLASFHSRKKMLSGSAAGQVVGFITLGFSSVYREGFETVLFLQALVLEAGLWVVLQGVALGVLGVLAVGWLTFKLQSRLPYKRMLVVTGVLIGAVLLIMVGNTVHILQLVGWLSIHPIRTLTLPYWTGLWFGLFATWEGVSFQVGAGAFVIGCYYLAEWMRHRETRQRVVQHHTEAVY